MRRLIASTLLLAVCLTLIGYHGPALAQEEGVSTAPPEPLSLFTDYPSQVVGVGENVSINLKLTAGTTPQIVNLELKNLPEGWNASFKGGTRIVQSLFVRPEKESSVDLKFTVPTDVSPGSYNFEIVASGERAQASIPLEIIVEQKLPPSLSLSVDLPVVRGKPDATFRYSATLKNEGDEDLNVDLLADSPPGFSVTFKSGGQDVTTLPVEANASKSISIEVSPLFRAAADSYPVNISAQAGEASAQILLTAEVVGQAELSLSTPDGRLSGDVPSGKNSVVNLLLQNSGSANAEGVTLSATAPNGWTVTFDPESIAELVPGQQAAVTAHLQPADKAIAGDYVMSFKAQPKGSTIESIDYRATVRTSTLWGIGGVILIAVAVGVVGLAVSRFGRR